jgi:hypothetical protein
VSLIPARGNINALHELALASARSNPATSAQVLLRVRALDWGNPALSEFRCELFRVAEKRYARAAKSRPAGLAQAATVAHVVALALDDILTLRIGSRAPASLVVGTPGQVVALARADADTSVRLHDALLSGSLGEGREACQRDGFCLLDLSEWGDSIEDGFETFRKSPTSREVLRRIRCERVAALLQRFPNRPALPLAEIFPFNEIECR